MVMEGVGFEPTRPVKACRFSRPVHSTNSATPPKGPLGRDAYAGKKHNASVSKWKTMEYRLFAPLQGVKPFPKEKGPNGYHGAFKTVARDRVELSTQGFSVLCSTN